MKVLFDQGTPVPLRRLLPGHEIATAHEMGWATLTNGDFLAAAEAADFVAIITTDKNLRHQQNLRRELSESWCCRRRNGPPSRRTQRASRRRLSSYDRGPSTR